MGPFRLRRKLFGISRLELDFGRFSVTPISFLLYFSATRRGGSKSLNSADKKRRLRVKVSVCK